MACARAPFHLSATVTLPAPIMPGIVRHSVAIYGQLLQYCFVANACATRPGAAASVKRRRRERCILLAGVVGELAGVTRARQARPSSACPFSAFPATCVLLEH